MKYDCDEIMIKTALDTIETPTYNMNFEVEKKIKTRDSRKYLNQSKFMIVSLSLFLILSVSVAAATMDSFNRLISMVSPEIALLLQPIGVISEEDGIKVEVVGAFHDDEMAVVYFTMQDLVGDRVDETLDIYDYSFSGARMFNIQLVHYDEITKTATLRMEANGGKKLSGKKVSFLIRSFLSDKTTFDEVDMGINLLEIQQTNAFQRVPLNMNNIPGGGGPDLDLYGELKEKGIIDVLKTDEMKIQLPNMDFMYISNIGYIDEYLHIQIKWSGDGVDDHGYLYFVDALGNKIYYNASVTFGADELGNTVYGSEYVEYIFDMSSIHADEVRLEGNFVSDNKYTEGSWKTTFKLESAEEKRVNCSLQSDTWKIHKVSVSPIGITFEGNGEVDDLQEISPSITMMDGSVQTFHGSRSYTEDHEFRLKFVSDTPLDTLKIKSITIDGQVIML